MQFANEGVHFLLCGRIIQCKTYRCFKETRDSTDIVTASGEFVAKKSTPLPEYLKPIGQLDFSTGARLDAL